MTSTQKWIIGVLILISMAVSGYVIGNIKEVNTDLQTYKKESAREAIELSRRQIEVAGQLPEKYVLKDDFRCTVEDLKKQLGKMDDKLDFLMKKSRDK